jgi:hypothetical protein
MPDDPTESTTDEGSSRGPGDLKDLRAMLRHWVQPLVESFDTKVDEQVDRRVADRLAVIEDRLAVLERAVADLARSAASGGAAETS